MHDLIEPHHIGNIPRSFLFQERAPPADPLQYSLNVFFVEALRVLRLPVFHETERHEIHSLPQTVIKVLRERQETGVHVFLEQFLIVLQSGLYLEQSFLILIKLNLIRNYKFLHYIDDI